MNVKVITGCCLLPLLLTAVAACSLRDRHRSGYDDSRRTLDSLFAVWNAFQYKGEMDSLASEAKPWLEYFMEIHDTEGIVYSAAAIAQAYSIANMDSCSRYADIVAEYADKAEIHDTKLELVMLNIKAANSLKTDLDYTEALNYYISAYELIKNTDDIRNRLAFLCNIVNLFYVRSDNQGMRYARAAYELSSIDGNFTQMHEYPYLSMAQMYYLSDSLPQAVRFLDMTQDMALKSGHSYVFSSIYLLRADILSDKGDTAGARINYDLALANAQESEPGINSLIYLHYGALCESANDKEKAVGLYIEGLEVSEGSYNMEFRGELLRRIADLYQSMGNDGKAMSYYKEFSDFVRKYNNIKRENGFSNLLVSYIDMEHRNEMNEKQLALLKVSRERTVLFAIIVVVAILCGSLIVMYKRQRQMYKTLVAQHQSFLKQMNAESINYGAAEEATGEQSDGKLKELFISIEQTMRDEKFFKVKNISLDTLAKKINSNRSYVSKAINTFAGVSFYQYVNSYRIREAASIISSPGNDMPFKQLADELGYNSVSVFGQAFKKEIGCTPNFYRREVRSYAAVK